MQAEQVKAESSSGLTFLWTLYAVAIICGAALMALEIVGGRLLTPFFGGSVYVWGSIISVFLTALSLGYYLGGIAADRKPTLLPLAILIAISGLLILLIPPFAAPLSRYFFSSSLANFGALVVSVLLFFMPSLGLGMVSPYVVKLGVSGTERLGNVVGKFYAVSTFGSIFGTLATTFLLVPFFGVKEVIFTLGTILVLLGTVLSFGQRLWTQGLLMVLILLVLSGTSLLEPPTPEYLKRYTLVYGKESMYNDIFVRDLGDYRFLMFNDDSHQSAMKKSDPDNHVINYTRLMVIAAQEFKPQANSALLIGLGGGTMPKALLAEDEDIGIDAVEIDPEVIRVAREYFGMPRTSRLNVAAMDGRMFLQEKDGKYDVIMLDAYNRLFIPHHLTTKEFFAEMSSALKPGGVIVINVISSPEGEYSTFFKSLLFTAKQTFPEWRVFMAENRRDTETNNLVLVLSRSRLDLVDKLADFNEYRKPFDFTNSVILTDNYAPVEILAAKLMSNI